jgi:LPS export ABC transporter protein LptC
MKVHISKYLVRNREQKLPGLFIIICLAFLSCKNDIETINSLTSDLNLPDQSGYNVEIEYTDSGLLQGKIITPELHKYDRVDEPYVEFPKGLRVLFYDKQGNAESYIRARYAIYHEKDQLWEARNDVVAENQHTGEKLETEQLFWDQKNERIYSEKFSKITNSDGVFYGENGFDARQDLSKWRLKGSSGTVNVRSDQQGQPGS